MNDEMGNMCSMHGNIQITTKFYSLNSKVKEQLEGLSTGKEILLKQSQRSSTRGWNWMPLDENKVQWPIFFFNVAMNFTTVQKFGITYPAR